MTARPLRIVSYNVRYFGHALRGLASTAKSKAGIAAGLAALEPVPDVICLQEVETISLRSKLAARRTPSDETQLESFMDELEAAYRELGQELPFEAFYFRAHTYRFGGTAIYTTGLAVLVNRHTLRVQDHNVEAPEHITHHHVVRWKDRKQSRICAHVRLADLKGRPIHVFNTHLSLPTPFAKEFWSVKEKMGFGSNQVHEARKLSAFVRRHAVDEPFIVCGDFNSPPASPVYKLLCEEGEFIGAQENLGLINLSTPRGFPTAGFMALRMHLDHVFSGNGIRWVDMKETAPFGSGRFHGLSDHVPLIARFSLPDELAPGRRTPNISLDAQDLAAKLSELTSLVEASLIRSGFSQSVFEARQRVSDGECRRAFEDLCNQLLEVEGAVTHQAFGLVVELGTGLGVQREVWRRLEPPAQAR